jgi:hypothetical protein
MTCCKYVNECDGYSEGKERERKLRRKGFAFEEKRKEQGMLAKGAKKRSKKGNGEN